MATFKKFEDIQAWQKARLLWQQIHKISKETGLDKNFRLKDQVCAAAGSVMDNIAEGFGRGGNAEFIQFLEISNGSTCEVQSQLYRILDSGYISPVLFEELYNLAEEIKGKLLAFIAYLKTSPLKGPKYRDYSNGRPKT